MIIQRIKLRAFGPFIQPITLPGEDDVFAPDLNIIAGNNEVGKTTLFNALQHLLFTPYRTRSVEMENLRPWGRNLAPVVEANISVRGTTYRIYKRFLNEPQCIVREYRNGQYLDMSEGDEADEFVRRLLLGERPGRGPARFEDCGLARLLWIPQGKSDMLRLEGELRQQVEAALNVATKDAWELQLIDKIASYYSSFWTRTGRRLANSPLSQKEREVLGLREQCKQLQSQIELLEEYGKQLEASQREVANLDKQIKQIAEALEQLQGEKEAIKELEEKVKTAEAELKRWDAEFKAASDRKQQLDEAKKSLKEAEDELEGKIIPEEQRLLRELELAEKEQNRLEEDLKNIKESLNEAKNRLRQAQTIVEAKQQKKLLTDLQSRYCKASNLQEQLQKKQQELQGMPNLDEKTVTFAQELAQQLSILAAKLESIGLSITFTPTSSRLGSFAADGGTAEEFRAQEDHPLTFRAVRRAKLDLVDVGSLDITSGAQELADAEKNREEKTLALQTLLARFSVSDVNQLEQVYRARQAIENDIENLAKDFKRELQPQEDLAELEEVIRINREKYLSLLEQLNMSDEQLMNTPDPDVQQCEEDVSSINDKEQDLQQEKTKVTNGILDLRKQHSTISGQKGACEEKKRDALNKLNNLLQQTGSEEEIEKQLAEAFRQRQAADISLQHLKKQLPPDDEQHPSKRYERLKEQQSKFEEAWKQRRDETVRLQERIRQIAENGSYEKLSQLQEYLALAEQECKQYLRQACAARLLNELIQKRQGWLASRLTDPISSKVSQYFERVSGQPGRKIHFDDAMQLSSISCQGVDGIPPSVLSQGAQEQLKLLTKLALARYIAQKEGPMLFLLDDALVHTDPDRFERLLDLLEEASTELQIVVLTCHPERYKRWGKARQILLPAQM